MKPFFFLCVTCVVAGCGGLLKSQSKGETGVDSAIDSLSSTDVASDNASDWAPTDVADDAATDALGGYETCPLSGGGVMRVPPNHRASTTCPARAATTSVDPAAAMRAIFRARVTRIAPRHRQGFATSTDAFRSACPTHAMPTASVRAGRCARILRQCVRADCCRWLFGDADCGPCGFCSPSWVEKACACMTTTGCNETGWCGVGTADGWQQVPCSCSNGCGSGYFCPHAGRHVRNRHRLRRRMDGLRV